MAILRTWLFMAAVTLSSSLVAQPTIDASNWPYGTDQIGNLWNYHNSSGTVPVNITTINPYLQGGSWDFSTGPTGSTASSELRSAAEAPAPLPPGTTFAEYQTAGGNAQWVYEDEQIDGIYVRGISQGGTVYQYSPPYYNVYRYPMTSGTAWNSQWTWNVAGIPVQSSRNNQVVGWGTVTVPFGGPLPCLVIRTAYSDYGEFSGIPIIDEEYKIYEWVCPGVGSVVTIQSANHESNWYFTSATAFYRLNESNVGGDLAAPVIAAVTQLTDTPSPGPFSVNATIVDPSGIDSAALLYSVAGGPWLARAPESIGGDVYTFLIPALAGSPVQQVRYYIWARDASPSQNIGRSPADAPATYYSFNWINDNVAPQFAGVTVWPSPTYFNGPYPVSATVTDDSGILFASLHYRFGNGVWQETAADSSTGSIYFFTIPGISATTIIRYYLEAVDNSGFFNTGLFPAAGINGPIVFQAVYVNPVPPQAISDLTIRPFGSDIRLNWSDITQNVEGNPITVSHYDVYRGSAADGSDGTLIGTSVASDYMDVGVVNAGGLYFYNVRAVAP